MKKAFLYTRIDNFENKEHKVFLDERKACEFINQVARILVEYEGFVVENKNGRNPVISISKKNPSGTISTTRIYLKEIELYE